MGVSYKYSDAARKMDVLKVGGRVDIKVENGSAALNLQRFCYRYGNDVGKRFSTSISYDGTKVNIEREDLPPTFLMNRKLRATVESNAPEAPVLRAKPVVEGEEEPKNWRDYPPMPGRI